MSQNKHMGWTGVAAHTNYLVNNSRYVGKRVKGCVILESGMVSCRVLMLV